MVIVARNIVIINYTVAIISGKICTEFPSIRTSGTDTKLRGRAVADVTTMKWQSLNDILTTRDMSTHVWQHTHRQTHTQTDTHTHTHCLYTRMWLVKISTLTAPSSFYTSGLLHFLPLARKRPKVFLHNLVQSAQT